MSLLDAHERELWRELFRDLGRLFKARPILMVPFVTLFLSIFERELLKRWIDEALA